jgi:hypothetical protein
MSVRFDGGLIILAGECGVEEAETLLNLIQANPGAAVDVGAAGAVHTALWQVLLALAPPVVGQAADPFVARWIIPALTNASAGVTAT